MAKRTLQEQLCAGLVTLGATPLRDRGKYRVYTSGTRRWYVGKSGALRVGDTIARSTPVADNMRQYVLTASTLRPIIKEILAAMERNEGLTRTPELDLTALTYRVLADPRLASESPQIVRGHINSWYKAKTDDNRNN